MEDFAQNFVAILVLTTPIWGFFLLLGMSRLITGKTAKQRAYERQVRIYEGHVARGESEAQMIQEAARRQEKRNRR